MKKFKRGDKVKLLEPVTFTYTVKGRTTTFSYPKGTVVTVEFAKNQYLTCRNHFEIIPFHIESEQVTKFVFDLKNLIQG